MSLIGSYRNESMSAPMCGNLFKQGRRFRQWTMRYYVVKGIWLGYYPEITDETPKKLINLERCTIQSSTIVKDGKYGFALTNGTRKYLLFAESAEDSKKWIEILQQSTKVGRRSVVDANRITDTSFMMNPPPKLKRAISRTVAKIDELYKVGEELGSGGFSTVHLGVSKEDNKSWALKMITKSTYNKNKERIDEEISILASLDHPGIVKMKEVVRTNKYVVIVMEVLDGGELFDRIVGREKYSENDAKTVALQLLECVQYLHSNHICHRDLKPENLLFSSTAEDAKMKLTDFGFATVVHEDDTELTTSCGTPEYAAPEVVDETPYNVQVDMWSCGVIIYIILCGFPPFYGETESELFDKICSANYSFPSPYWDFVSDQAKDLIKHLLQVNPRVRYTAEKALAHPWLHQQGQSNDLSAALSELKRYNATKKFRKTVLLVLAVVKLRSAVEIAKQRSK